MTHSISNPSIGHLEATSTPHVLPAFVRVVSRPIIDADASEPVPARLQDACLKRRREFVAGRQCAATALQLLGAAEWSLEIGTGAAGEPLWPEGFTGSITHTDAMAACAVTAVSCASSIGLDAEPMVDAARAARLSRVVLHACESRLKGHGLDSASLFTLMFSAKEALFKCLYPLVQRRFDYRDAAVRQIDVPDRRVVIELLTTLAPGYERGLTLTGGFATDNGVVITGFHIAQGSK